MRNQDGNVFIYILIAIVLLAALNAIISRSGEEDGSSQRLSEAKRSLLVDEIMLHASAAEKAVRNMETSGTDISFNAPSADNFYATPRNSGGSPAYDARPLHNLLHPKGGGLQHKSVDSYPDSLFSGSKEGWLYQTKTNVGWTKPSSPNDIIMALSGINESVCKAINKRITGSTSIPSASDTAANLFDGETTPNNPLTSGVCSDCEGRPALCIHGDDGSGDYIYYNILVTQ